MHTEMQKEILINSKNIFWLNWNLIIVEILFMAILLLLHSRINNLKDLVISQQKVIDGIMFDLERRDERDVQKLTSFLKLKERISNIEARLEPPREIEKPQELPEGLLGMQRH